jgi:hypothetical protein
MTNVPDVKMAAAGEANLYLIIYRHDGREWRTVGEGPTPEAAAASFRRDHPHVELVRCE